MISTRPSNDVSPIASSRSALSIPKDLVARERLRDEGVDGLFLAAEELQADRERLVGIDRIGHRHDVDATVTPALVDEPADHRQPVRTGVPNGPLRPNLRARRSSRFALDGDSMLIRSLPRYRLLLSQMLDAPRAQALVVNEVVVHRRLAVVAEVQHAWLVVQEALRIVKQAVEAEKARAVGR